MHLFSRSFVPSFIKSFYCYHYQDDTEVTIVWAFRGTDANVDLSKHTATGILSGKHNMIKEAMEAKTGTKPNTGRMVFPSTAIFLAGMTAYFLAF